jgi:hypothetical protein
LDEFASAISSGILEWGLVDFSARTFDLHTRRSSDGLVALYSDVFDYNPDVGFHNMSFSNACRFKEDIILSLTSTCCWTFVFLDGV